MKFSYCYILLSLLSFLSCEKKPSQLLVRPIEKAASDSLYNHIFPFDNHPTLGFRKRWCCGRSKKNFPDTTFTDRIRLKTNAKMKRDAVNTFPALLLDVVMPDSVQLGDGFFYLLVMEAKEGAAFSKMRMEPLKNQKYQVRVFQQKMEYLTKPRSEYEEILRSFYPAHKGQLEFDFFYNDSLVLSREIVVF